MIYASYDEDIYTAKVTKILTENPNDIDVIINAGIYFYKRQNYTKAIWYWSSPNLASNDKYEAIKYFQAVSHFKIGETTNAKFVLGQINLDNVSKSIRRKVINLRNKLNEGNTKGSLGMSASISYYQASVLFSENVQKQKASINGLYLMVFESETKVEAAIEQLSIEYSEGVEVEDYNQTDYSMFVTNFSKDLSGQVKFGVHINTTDTFYAYSSNSALLGFGAFSNAGSYIGIDLSYNLFSSNGEVGAFTSTQATPNLKWRLTNWLYLKGAVNSSQNTYEKEGVEPVSNYLSTELEAGLDFDIISLSYSVTNGEEQFFFKNDGFMIQNSTDKTLKSTSVSATLNLGQFSVTGKHSINNYQEESNDEVFKNEATIFFATINF